MDNILFIVKIELYMNINEIIKRIVKEETEKIINKWIYFGVFLDNTSSDILKKEFEKIIPEDWTFYCHHMTISFNNRSEEANNCLELYKNRIGENVNLIATHLGMSDDAIAVRIAYQDKTTNKIPHITIATPKGGKPVNSNFIKEWKLLKEPIHLSGKIQII